MLRQIWRMVGALGLAASALSLANLIFQGFQLGVSAPVQMMLAYYESILQFALGWAQPAISQLAQFLHNWIGISLHPSPEWKHIFVLVWLYFSCDARSSILQGRTITAGATVAFGLLVSLAAILASGGLHSVDQYFLLVAVGAPLTGFLLHAIMESFLTVIFYREPARSIADALRYYFMTEVLSAIASAIAACGIAVATAPYAGASWSTIASLSGFVVIRGCFWLLRGVYIGLHDRAPGETWQKRFARSGSGQFGMLIFSVIFAALLFVALNAGLDG
ncbi:MAG: hypothetical protein JNM59_12100 [Hyphomonadaceae bacterium]|nr:hypothetical protein [Hyphomonadaceae bacterium]